MVATRQELRHGTAASRHDERANDVEERLGRL
jgi:hypothetical protein